MSPRDMAHPVDARDRSALSEDALTTRDLVVIVVAAFLAVLVVWALTSLGILAFGVPS